MPIESNKDWQNNRLLLVPSTWEQKLVDEGRDDSLGSQTEERVAEIPCEAYDRKL